MSEAQPAQPPAFGPPVTLPQPLHSHRSYYTVIIVLVVLLGASIAGNAFLYEATRTLASKNDTTQAQVNNLQNQVNTLQNRVAALQSRPDLTGLSGTAVASGLQLSTSIDFSSTTGGGTFTASINDNDAYSLYLPSGRYSVNLAWVDPTGLSCSTINDVTTCTGTFTAGTCIPRPSVVDVSGNSMTVNFAC